MGRRPVEVGAHARRTDPHEELGGSEKEGESVGSQGGEGGEHFQRLKRKQSGVEA